MLHIPRLWKQNRRMLTACQLIQVWCSFCIHTVRPQPYITCAFLKSNRLCANFNEEHFKVIMDYFRRLNADWGINVALSKISSPLFVYFIPNEANHSDVGVETSEPHYCHVLNSRPRPRNSRNCAHTPLPSPPWNTPNAATRWQLVCKCAHVGVVGGAWDETIVIKGV